MLIKGNNKRDRNNYTESIFKIIKEFGKNPEALINASFILSNVSYVLQNKGKMLKRIHDLGVKYYEEGKGDLESCFSWAAFDVSYEEELNNGGKRRRKKKLSQ